MIASYFYSMGLSYHADFVLREHEKKKKELFFFYEFEVDYKYAAKASWANQHMKIAWSSLNGLELVKGKMSFIQINFIPRIVLHNDNPLAYHVIYKMLLQGLMAARYQNDLPWFHVFSFCF